MASKMTLTGTMDNLRQGTSIRSFRQQFGNPTPTINAGGNPKIFKVHRHMGKELGAANRKHVELVAENDTAGFDDTLVIGHGHDAEYEMRPNMDIEENTIGQPDGYLNEPGYEDMDDYDPVRYIQSGDTLLFPIVLSNASLRDPGQKSGIIEPLDIRETASRMSTFSPFPPNRVRGFLGIGDEDSRDRSVEISNFISQVTASVNPYEDSAGIHEIFDGPTDSSGSFTTQLLDPGYINDADLMTSPFEDSSDPEILFEQLIPIGGTTAGITDSEMRIEIINANQQLVSGVMFNDTLLPMQSVSAPSGFDYSTNGLGTDSIAFGDLFRK